MAGALTKNKQKQLVVEKFQLMEKFLNKMEEELSKPDDKINLNVVANYHGKASQVFTEISFHLDIFDKNPNIFQ